MLDPLDFENRPLISRLSRKRLLASLVLWIEICGKSLWRIVSWLALFAGLWLLQIPEVIGSFGPALSLLVFLAGLLWLARTDLPKLRRPAQSDADRLLEQTGGLHHRPISALEDRLANPKKEPTRKLWQKNRETALIVLDQLRVPAPRPSLPQNDPYALRILAVLILVTGLVAAGPQWQDRLSYGLFPFSFGRNEPSVSPITLWITPPDYTAMPQVTLQGSGKRDEALQIPEGSVLKIRVNDGFTQPRLVMGDKELPLKQKELGTGNYGDAGDTHNPEAVAADAGGYRL